MAEPTSLAFAVEGTPAGPRVVWHGEADLSADELLKPAGKRDLPRDKARRFLQETLTAGPRRVPEVVEAAGRAGMAEMTLKRARAGRGVFVLSRPGPAGHVYYWSLTEEPTPAPAPAPVEDLAAVLAAEEAAAVAAVNASLPPMPDPDPALPDLA